MRARVCIHNKKRIDLTVSPICCDSSFQIRFSSIEEIIKFQLDIGIEITRARDEYASHIAREGRMKAILDGLEAVK